MIFAKYLLFCFSADQIIRTYVIHDFGFFKKEIDWLLVCQLIHRPYFFIKLIDIAKILSRRHQKLNLRTISQDILQKLLEYCITFLDDNVIYVD